MENKKEGILLESGTNEVEMMEFTLNGVSYCVNVSKVSSLKEFKREELVNVNTSPPELLGFFDYQDKVIPVMNIKKILSIKDSEELEHEIVLVMSLNKFFVAFLVDSVRQIHRLTWDQFTPCTYGFEKATTLGIVNTNGQEIIVLDFEKIVGDIFPDTSIEHISADTKNAPQRIERTREKLKIVHVDDSQTVRKIVSDMFGQCHFTEVKSFTDGQNAYEHFVEIAKEIAGGKGEVSDYVDAMIIDIEMPRMDGLTLCKKIREELKWDNVFIIMFSSLIDEQMKEKCRLVGADDQISKPQIGSIIAMVDQRFSEANIIPEAS